MRNWGLVRRWEIEPRFRRGGGRERWVGEEKKKARARRRRRKVRRDEKAGRPWRRRYWRGGEERVVKMVVEMLESWDEG